MSVIKGLAAINQELAKRKTGDFEDRPKAKYLQLKDGESAKLVFLQEIDDASPNYSAKNGLAIFSLQHTSPKDFKRSAACTASEGPCFGCQQGWKQKIILYINVLVDNGMEEPFVAIWNRGLGKGSPAQGLLDTAADEDFGNSISDKYFKFSRTGSTKDNTTYSLNALPKPHELNVESYELFDLEKYIFTVPFDKQAAYYGFVDGDDSEPATPAPGAAANSSANASMEW